MASILGNKEIRVAIVGIGNCASSLIQGIIYYGKTSNQSSPGLLHKFIGPYSIKSIKPVVGFDIDERKVGKDISEAIFQEPNVTAKFSEVPFLGAKVFMGPVLDGYPKHMDSKPRGLRFSPSSEPPSDVIKILKENRVDVVINYLPVGSQQATEFYANASLEAGCAFVNCMPIFIASNEEWIEKFKNKGLPVLGDDVKSQLGATWIHRVIIQSFLDKGIRILNTKQENFAGNTDFLNMSDQDRIKTKLISKRSSIEHLIKDHRNGGYIIPPVYAGPSQDKNNHGYDPTRKDRKKAIIGVNGIGFGNQPVNLKIELEVEDSPNSAAIGVDAIRCAKLALDRKIGGAIPSASAFFFKHPYEKITDNEAIVRLESFIKGDLEK